MLRVLFIGLVLISHGKPGSRDGASAGKRRLWYPGSYLTTNASSTRSYEEVCVACSLFVFPLLFFFFFVYFFRSEASEVPLLISRLACRSIHIMMMIGLSFTSNHPWYIQLFFSFSFFYLKFIMFSGSSSATLKKCADNVIAPP